jgi:hypothetical protein
LTFQGVHDILIRKLKISPRTRNSRIRVTYHYGHCLAFSMLSVVDGIADEVLKEDLKNMVSGSPRMNMVECGSTAV